jgi:hypothetical protein
MSYLRKTSVLTADAKLVEDQLINLLLMPLPSLILILGSRDQGAEEPPDHLHGLSQRITT